MTDQTRLLRIETYRVNSLLLQEMALKRNEKSLGEIKFTSLTCVFFPL